MFDVIRYSDDSYLILNYTTLETLPMNESEALCYLVRHGAGHRDLQAILNHLTVEEIDARLALRGVALPAANPATS
jgi:hypothetical protein